MKEKKAFFGLKIYNLFLVFLLGAILGPIGDFFHVLTETTDYPQEIFGLYFWRLPFWVPILFGSGAVLITVIQIVLDDWLKRKHIFGTLTKEGVIIGAAITTAQYILSGYLPKPPGGISDAILASISILVWFLYCRTWQGLVYAVIAATMGMCFEIYIISQGAFWYNENAHNFFGVPTWLGWLYVTASISIANFGRYLILYSDKTKQPKK